MKKLVLWGLIIAVVVGLPIARAANFWWTPTGESIPGMVVNCATGATLQGVPIAIPCPSGQTNMANSTSVTVAYDQTPVQVKAVPGAVGQCQPNFLTKQVKPWPFCY